MHLGWPKDQIEIQAELKYRIDILFLSIEYIYILFINHR